MEEYKKREYLNLINELLACKGIGALITSIQKVKDRFDGDFFACMDEEMRDAKDRGDNKREKALSYLYRIMENLHIGPGMSSVDNSISQKEPCGIIDVIKKLFFSKI